MQLFIRFFIRSVLLIGVIADVIGVAFIDWRSTLSGAFKLEISGMVMVVAAGALWLEYRIRTSDVVARIARNRVLVAVFWVVFSLALTAGADSTAITHPCSPQ
jgi:hypothetical protein